MSKERAGQHPSGGTRSHLQAAFGSTRLMPLTMQTSLSCTPSLKSKLESQKLTTGELNFRKEPSRNRTSRTLANKGLSRTLANNSLAFQGRGFLIGLRDRDRDRDRERERERDKDPIHSSFLCTNICKVLI